MALQKQNISINFSGGMDSKPDPFQLKLGEFVDLENMVFDKLGALTKRNGFKALSSLPLPASFLTTFKGNLTAIGNVLQSYAKGPNSWINSGNISPLTLSTLPVVKNSVNQTQADSVVSTNGLVCTVYTETTGAATSYKYVVADSTTGQNVVAPAALSADATYGSPRVFFLGSYFIIVYVNHPGAYNLKYIAINSANLVVGSPQTISNSITPATTVAFDGVVFGSNLYLAWNGASSSGIKCCILTSTLSLTATVNPDASHVATMVSVTADATANVIWISYYNLGTTTGYSLAVSAVDLSTVLSAKQIISSGTILNITSSAQNTINTVFYEVSNTYGYDGSIATNYVQSITVTQAGSVGSAATVARSIGLASKSFIISGNIYFLATYSSSYQPTYFIISAASTQASPQVVAQLAYSNGGGYLTLGLPSAVVNGTSVSIAYLFKDLVQAVNKNTNVPSGSQVNGIYSQTGVNLVTFNFITSGISQAEIGNDLHLGCGFLWSYDGITPVEHNFFLYPDNVESPSQPTTGGHLSAQVYFYQWLYRWTDNQGNVFRSACSIPLKVDISGSGTSTNEIVLKIPTLRLTYKTSNPVVIEGYRWSTAQQSYYQVTSVSTPLQNDTTSDFVTFTDTLSDSTILGNNLLYTTGGVLEDMSPPAFNAMTLFDTRLWGIDAEDPNVLWFSKTVLEATPVEFSSEETLYIAPNVSEAQNTGPMKCIFPMDDKLIIFKDSTLFYINGTGPDATGANSQYSEPTFIASPVGCSNPNSIVLTPQGLMFQSLKGIWILKRDLSTDYIGAPMEKYNSANVLSAVSIPSSNRVVFTLDNGISLMYDYFVNRWGTFVNIPGLSSVIYQGLHTYISTPVTITPPSGASYTTASTVYQENPGSYLDGSNPVLMSWITGWISMAGLQGYKRAYWLFLLGQYYSPHILSIGIAYDFNPSITQLATINPTNSYLSWGGDDEWGVDDLEGLPNAETWGGTSAVEQWQIGFQRTNCQAFQLSLSEAYDSTKGIPAGAGFSLTAMNLVAGIKKGYPTNIPLSNKTG